MIVIPSRLYCRFWPYADDVRLSPRGFWHRHFCKGCKRTDEERGVWFDDFREKAMAMLEES